jgi:hypothetical protein
MNENWRPNVQDRMMFAVTILAARHIKGSLVTDPDKAAEQAVKAADALMKKLVEIPFPLDEPPRP